MSFIYAGIYVMKAGFPLLITNCRIQISRVARRRQIAEMETGKVRMVHGLLKKWPSLIRETFVMEEAAWIMNCGPEVLQKNAKRAMQAMAMLPDSIAEVCMHAGPQ